MGLNNFSENNLGLKFVFNEDQAWLYCAFVHGEARGKGIYKRLLSFVAQAVKQRGYSQLLSVINPWNRISILAHGKHSTDNQRQRKTGDCHDQLNRQNLLEYWRDTPIFPVP